MKMNDLSFVKAIHEERQALLENNSTLSKIDKNQLAELAKGLKQLNTALNYEYWNEYDDAEAILQAKLKKINELICQNAD